jgi:hypothetical protein
MVSSLCLEISRCMSCSPCLSKLTICLRLSLNGQYSQLPPLSITNLIKVLRMQHAVSFVLIYRFDTTRVGHLVLLYSRSVTTTITTMMTTTAAAMMMIRVSCCNTLEPEIRVFWLIRTSGLGCYCERSRKPNDGGVRCGAITVPRLVGDRDYGMLDYLRKSSPGVLMG